MDHLQDRLRASPDGAAPGQGMVDDGTGALPAQADIAVRTLLFVASVVRRLHTVPEDAADMAPG